jgi:predicted helicase
VHVLDPFTGTGNFIVNIIRRLPKTSLANKYRQELHCNEVMLLPYYVASMNIEHAYYEATGQYAPFEGVCLVDTFQTAETPQREFSWFNEQNSLRVARQTKAPVRVVIANPPYNAGQINENDNNKNRKYPRLDRHVSETYGKSSTATLRRKLRDPYVKAILYAGERIGDSGIVCFVNNSSFVTERTFDGMRKQLVKDFDLIYVLDLGGNVRKHPDLSGSTHNVFGIQLGVSINLFVRLPRAKSKGEDISRSAVVRYFSVPIDWRREQKYAFLENKVDLAKVKWRRLKPDKKGNWLKNTREEEFAAFVPLGSKGAKAGSSLATVFQTYSLGVSTNRDRVVYDFNAEHLAKRVKQFADDYNAELRRWQAQDRPNDDDIDDFVSYERVKWSETLKRFLMDGESAVFDVGRIRKSLYRPFTQMQLYYASLFVDRPGSFSEVFPSGKVVRENRLLCVNLTVERPFCCLAANLMPNLVCAGGFGCATYGFPLFRYSEDGEERRDNISPQSLRLFRNHYCDSEITHEDVFNFCYAFLHHPVYRERYRENLKRTLPRIPFIAAGIASAPFGVAGGTDDPRTPDEVKADLALFRAFVDAGQRLAELHVAYGRQKEYPLERVENKDVPLDWRVERMKLSKDRCSIRYNDFLTLAGIPGDVFGYRLGNRSALDWVIDQYRVTRDQHGKVVRDPNRPDDEQYIIRLIGQVITVSVETVKVINSLPELRFE